jgi:hypothetical protein
MRVAVIKVGDQTDIHLVVLSVIHESASPAIAFTQWPAQTVYHEAFFVFFRRDFPYFLDADSIVLGILACIEGKLLNELLAKVAAAALGEQGIFRMQFHTRHVAVFMLAIDTHTHVAGGYAFYPPIVVVKNLRGSEAWIDFNTQTFSLFGQPAADITHGDNIIAFIVRGFRNHEVWQLDGTFLAQIEEDLSYAEDNEGRDASSIEKAVIIKYTGDYQESIGLEYIYIATVYGKKGTDYQVLGQSLRRE